MLAKVTTWRLTAISPAPFACRMHEGRCWGSGCLGCHFGWSYCIVRKLVVKVSFHWVLSFSIKSVWGKKLPQLGLVCFDIVCSDVIFAPDLVTSCIYALERITLPSSETFKEQ